MHTIMKRFLALTMLACFPLVFSACGSSEDAATVEMTTISGVAIKGPIKGALVQIYKLKNDGSDGELLGSGISGNDATYAIQVPKAKAVAPLLVKVSGRPGAVYLSETTNSDVKFESPAESFRAVIDTFDPTKKYTVSPLTDAAYQQIQKFITDNPTAAADTKIISLANSRVATLFSVSDVLADPATDPTYSAALKVIDQMVVNTGTSDTTQTMTLINQAFADVGSTATPSKPYLYYQAALTNAAVTVVNRDATLTSVVNTIVTTTANPVAEPVWTDTTPPDAVTGFKVVNIPETASTSSATLTWKAATTKGSNPVTGYDIFRNGAKIATVTALSYVDKPLVPVTVYKYSVVAFDAAGSRAPASSEVSITTPAVLNLDITAGGHVAGIGSSSASLPAVSIGGQLTSDVSLKDIVAPTAPSNLSATVSTTNAAISSVKLTWKAATDNIAVTRYDIYRDGTFVGTTPLLTFTYALAANGVAAGYTVVAFDAADNRSAASAALSVTPVVPNLDVTAGGQLDASATPDGVGVATPPALSVNGQLTSGVSTQDVAAPTTPSGLASVVTAKDAATSSVKLTWSASSDNVAVTGYEIFRNGTLLGTSSQLTYTDTAAANGVASDYTVKAFDAAGNRSAASATLTVTPVAPNLTINVGGQVSS